MRKKIAALMAIVTMMAGSNVYAAEQTGVYDGVTYTVGVSCSTLSASGYGRYADTSKGIELTVELIYKDYSGEWHTITAKKSGTTYVTARTENGSSIDQSTKSARSKLYIAGFTAVAETN